MPMQHGTPMTTNILMSGDRGDNFLFASNDLYLDVISMTITNAWIESRYMTEDISGLQGKQQ